MNFSPLTMEYISFDQLKDLGSMAVLGYQSVVEILWKKSAPRNLPRSNITIVRRSHIKMIATRVRRHSIPEVDKVKLLLSELESAGRGINLNGAWGEEEDMMEDDSMPLPSEDGVVGVEGGWEQVSRLEEGELVEEEESQFVISEEDTLELTAEADEFE